MEKKIEILINCLMESIEYTYYTELLIDPFDEYLGKDLLIYILKQYIDLNNYLSLNNKNIEQIYIIYDNKTFKFKYIISDKKEEYPEFSKKNIFDFGLILLSLVNKNNSFQKYYNYYNSLNNTINDKISKKDEEKKNKIRIFDIIERMSYFIKSNKLLEEKHIKFIDNFIKYKQEDRVSLEEINTNIINEDNNEYLREEILAFPNDKQKLMIELQKNNYCKKLKEINHKKLKFNFKYKNK